MIDMASKDIIPAVVSYASELANSVIAVKEAGATARAQMEILNEVDELLAEAKSALDVLKSEEDAAKKIKNAKEQAFYYKDNVTVAMEALRAPVDKLEMIVDSSIWPIPTYGELMFEV